jgi:hypothetical protein
MKEAGLTDIRIVAIPESIERLSDVGTEDKLLASYMVGSAPVKRVNDAMATI